VAVNTSGNPGMAKGGSGDVLTGLVAGLMAQFPDDARRAVEAAVTLHGLAGDLAVRCGDEHTLLATDCLAHLAEAFRLKPDDIAAENLPIDGRNRYVWLQGHCMQQPNKSIG
jgi:ADP-dependent NAD(P)H-hydrate dehydratase / NAD(P)H-hydrate epimerase